MLYRNDIFLAFIWTVFSRPYVQCSWQNMGHKGPLLRVGKYVKDSFLVGPVYLYFLYELKIYMAHIYSCDRYRAFKKVRRPRKRAIII